MHPFKKNEIDSSSLSIIFIEQPNCEENQNTQNQLQAWEISLIIVGIAVVLIIIVLIILMLNPSIRSKIFVNNEEILKEKKSFRYR